MKKITAKWCWGGNTVVIENTVLVKNSQWGFTRPTSEADYPIGLKDFRGPCPSGGPAPAVPSPPKKIKRKREKKKPERNKENTTSKKQKRKKRKEEKKKWKRMKRRKDNEKKAEKKIIENCDLQKHIWCSLMVNNCSSITLNKNIWKRKITNILHLNYMCVFIWVCGKGACMPLYTYLQQCHNPKIHH